MRLRLITNRALIIARPLLPDQVQHDLASMSTNSVLDKIDALPRPKRRFASDDRNRDMSLRQRGTNMRRHVVGALSAVLEQRIAIRNKAREEPLQITHDFRIGVFLNQQTRRCVADENSQQPVVDLAATHPALNIARDLDECAAGGLYLQTGMSLTHLLMKGVVFNLHGER